MSTDTGFALELVSTDTASALELVSTDTGSALELVSGDTGPALELVSIDTGSALDLVSTDTGSALELVSTDTGSALELVSADTGSAWSRSSFLKWEELRVTFRPPPSTFNTDCGQLVAFPTQYLQPICQNHRVWIKVLIFDFLCHDKVNILPCRLSNQVTLRGSSKMSWYVIRWI